MTVELPTRREFDVAEPFDRTAQHFPDGYHLAVDLVVDTNVYRDITTGVLFTHTELESLATKHTIVEIPPA
jgi:hypothetical protein